MPAYEVSRTLVKSAPEVWAELERVERLAELLCDGTIEIVASRPESQIEWRGQRASGTIEIAASGWGTKVKLTAEAEEIVLGAGVLEPGVTMEQAAETEPAQETETAPESGVEAGAEREAEVGLEPETAESPEPETVVDLESELELEPVAETKSKPVGFWKRLFGKTAPAVETEVVAGPEPETIAEPEPEPEVVAEPEPEVVAEPEPEAVAESKPEEPAESAPAPEPESIDYEALLTSVLDHLGSAHKRPFTHA